MLPGDIISNIGRDERATLFISTARRTSVPDRSCGLGPLGVTLDDPSPDVDAEPKSLSLHAPFLFLPGLL